MAMSLWADVRCIRNAQTESSATTQMTIQWLIAARRIGKRLASIDPPDLSELSDETYEVICGVAGCVVKRKKFMRNQS